MYMSFFLYQQKFILAFDEFRGGLGRRVYTFLEQRNDTEKFTDFDVESFHRFVAYLVARGPEVGVKVIF